MRWFLGSALTLLLGIAGCGSGPGAGDRVVARFSDKTPETVKQERTDFENNHASEELPAVTRPETASAEPPYPAADIAKELLKLAQSKGFPEFGQFTLKWKAQNTGSEPNSDWTTQGMIVYQNKERNLVCYARESVGEKKCVQTIYSNVDLPILTKLAKSGGESLDLLETFGSAKTVDENARSPF